MKQESKGMTSVFSETTVDGSATVANFQAMMSEDKMNELFKQQEEMNQRVLERAKTVLTPEQLEAFAAHQSIQLQIAAHGHEHGGENVRHTEIGQLRARGSGCAMNPNGF